jgi:tetratricopeptide (TPR) repeat protein
MPGSIVTFYSYKGGAGRTMSLANIACLLAAAGHRVLAIDWDLEAPGLHRYLHPFLPDPDLSKTPGIIDLVWDYAAAAARPGSAEGHQFEPLSLADPGHVATATSFPTEGPDATGCLHMIGAGMQNSAYADRVRTFDWAALFSRLDGAAFIKCLGEKCRTAYDFTLIDSRTGIADTAGITTVLLPDRVVLCFTPNRQSVLGIRAIGESIQAARPSLRLLPVVARVEKGVEGWREAQIFYRSQLDHLLPPSATQATRAAYWGATEIVHYPNYALGELLAAFYDSPKEPNSLLSDMRRLVSRTIESEFMSSSDGFAAPEFSEQARRHYLRRIQFRDPRISELQAALDGDAPSALIAISSLLADLRREADPDPEWLKQIAPMLSNLSAHLSSLGRGEDALAAAEETVRLYRALTEARPDAFMPELARSLSNLVNTQSALGRREDALAAAEEAARLRRALAEARPDAFTPDLALSLNNLANMLSDLGRREEALAAGEEAVRHYRALAEARPDAFTPDLAMSLTTFATILSDLGRREEALASAEEAVHLYRDLARVRPDAFRPGLAMSLTTFANRLSDLGRGEEALAAGEEAVRLRRVLAEARPDAFTPDLALSLNNLVYMLSALGRREDALAAANEAVRLRRVLAEARPEAFTPNLAASLNNLANILSILGRREEALAAAEEAVSLRRALAEARPEAFTPGLARSLWVFGRPL